jgi:protein ImuB
LTALESHIPERAQIPAAALNNQAAGMSAGWSATNGGDPPTRPCWLLPRAELAEVIAGAPDDPPARIVWRRVPRRIVKAEGPERVTPEWWRGEGAAIKERTRDYYRVEDEAGRRYWVYREGLFADGQTPIWKVQGLFA